MVRLKAELVTDLTATAGPKGDTPLRVAARNGHVATIRVLVPAKAPRAPASVRAPPYAYMKGQLMAAAGRRTFLAAL